MSTVQPQEMDRLGADRDASARFDSLPRHEQRRLLQERLDTLSESLRLILALRHVEGLGIAELATALRMSPEEVTAKLTEAMRILMHGSEGLGATGKGSQA